MTIENAQALEAIFGTWPSFHDAEVMRVVLDRSGDEGPTLEAVIHVFRMTQEIDSRGQFVLTHHTEVALRFVGIVLERLQWFNSQNALNSLEIDEVDLSGHDGRRFRVSMPSSFGMEAEFECVRIVVATVRPFEPAV